MKMGLSLLLVPWYSVKSRLPIATVMYRSTLFLPFVIMYLPVKWNRTIFLEAFLWGIIIKYFPTSSLTALGKSCYTDEFRDYIT